MPLPSPRRHGDPPARLALPVEPPTLRVNPLRTRPESLIPRLEALGFRLLPVPGLPAMWRVAHEPYPISRTLEHWLGHFYLQQAATGVAALALGVREGERILDLCAAPGGKASHIAERLGETGLLVAGENNPGRVRALLGNLYRLGHAGVLAVSADGRSFPAGATFDRVLLDVPCSGEGNRRRRRGGGSSSPASESFRGHITGVQRALLRRAVDLVRPGGTLLYVTCTTAVEENEAVVARALARLPLSLQPIPLDLAHDPGWTRHGGRSYPAEMALAWRIRPDHLGSGSLFMALLRREGGALEGGSDTAVEVGGASADGWSAVPTAYRAEESGGRGEHMVREALAELKERLEVPAEALARFRWMARADSVWMHTVAAWPLDVWGPDASAGAGAGWRFVSLGIRAFRQESSGRLRATNDLLRRLDGAVRGRVLDFSRPEALALLDRGEVSVPGSGDGYSALRVDGHVVGRGFLRGGRLRSEIPRPQAALLAETLRTATPGSGRSPHSVEKLDRFRPGDL